VIARHLYVHVPFCARRCAYCDFSIAVRRVVPVDAYLAALRTEVRLRVGHNTDTPPAHTGARFESLELDTLYFGGGTPSILGGAGVGAMVSIIREHFAIAPDAEITLEANPDDVSPAAAMAWASAGVNRVSLGVQTFNDATLSWLHRTHSAEQARLAVATLREAGIENVSLDLIFALPSQLERSFSDDLDEALALYPDHISLYGLTIEDSTPLARWTADGRSRPPVDDVYAEEFLLAHDRATGAGLEHYEVSNFARPGRRSRHNSSYWSGQGYLGLGPSAHSFDGARRTWNVAPYAEWVSRLNESPDVTLDGEDLSDSNRAAERVYLGLRTSNGYCGSAADVSTAREWAAAGWADIDGSVIRLRPEGWLRLDALSAGLTGF